MSNGDKIIDCTGILILGIGFSALLLLEVGIRASSLELNLSLSVAEGAFEVCIAAGI